MLGMRTGALVLMTVVSVSTAMAGTPARYTCGDMDSGELFITNITEDNQVIFKNNATGVEEYSTVDVFTTGDSLTIMSGQLDQDGTALLEENCGPIGDLTKMLVIKGATFEKVRCLTCTPLELAK